MSKVLSSQKAPPAPSASKATPSAQDANNTTLDFEDFTTSSSIIEFLAKEQECCDDEDAESIFQEVSRLTDSSDTRSMDEILREAEILIHQQSLLGNGERSGASKSGQKTSRAQQSVTLNSKFTKSIESVHVRAGVKLTNGHHFPPTRARDHAGKGTHSHLTSPGRPARSTASTPTNASTPLAPTPNAAHADTQFAAFVENLPSASIISEESTPQDMQDLTFAERDATMALDDDDTDGGSDTMEEITEGMETIEMNGSEDPYTAANGEYFEAPTANAKKTNGGLSQSVSFSSLAAAKAPRPKSETASARRPSFDAVLQNTFASPSPAHLTSPTRRPPLNFNTTQACSPGLLERMGSCSVRRSSMTTPDSGIGQTQTTPRQYSPIRNAATLTKSFCDKSVNSSPKRMVCSLTSPIEPFASLTREHSLKNEIDLLQEKLKDTEERLQSLRIQHDSLSQLHRDMRESNARLQDESEVLKLDVQHLNECANTLRSELQAARADRLDAQELQKVLQAELEESRQEKKRTQDNREKDSKTIQDLQRQCREMERILMRKHPDSVSALIVASKNPGKGGSSDHDTLTSRKLLEQRIAQLEADAREQDLKAQQILANVQARFNSVQTKYETHIADLETQVLSLQEINTKLNEKIESQVRTLDYFVSKKAEKCYNNCTQTETDPQEVFGGSSGGRQTSSLATQTASSTRDHSTNTIGTAGGHSASSSTSSTANSTPNNSRPNSKQSGLRKPMASAGGSLTSMLVSKLPVSQSDSTISATAHHFAAKEDAHLLATIRGMRVDLAIKDKAMQRLTRELDDCKRTIRKLQKEKEVLKSEKPYMSSSAPATFKRHTEASSSNADHTPAISENQALREAQNKIKLLEADYKSLHDKRMHDLKTLQSAHERELASCHDTVRILQHRLADRDENCGVQKRRKLPVDYYALKAKVSSLERRHSEREERLHMLVEALSKGRLNGTLEDLLSENNNP